MPTAMRCWTKTAKDGHRYTTCDGNQGGAKQRVKKKVQKARQTMPQPASSSEVMPMNPSLQALVTGSMTQVASNVASLLRMNTDATTSKMMRKSKRPPTRFNQFDEDAEFKRKVVVAPRTMGTRGTPIEKSYSVGDSIADPDDEDPLADLLDAGFFDDVSDVDFEDLGEIEMTDDEE